MTFAALAGALIPDLSLYLSAGWHLFLIGTSPDMVFGQLYYSENWQAIFRIDNSFVLWGVGVGLALMGRSPVFIALCGAALLHLAFDFPLHHNDARAHFWPITNWKFVSPVSYWDPSHYGNVVASLEIGATIVLAAVVWCRFTGWGMRTLITVLGLGEDVPPILFAIIFAGS